MDVPALIIALVALVVALTAFARTGGIRELRGRIFPRLCSPISSLTTSSVST